MPTPMEEYLAQQREQYVENNLASMVFSLFLFIVLIGFMIWHAMKVDQMVDSFMKEQQAVKQYIINNNNNCSRCH